jgi:GDP-mannose 6-dehydrogenase
MNISVFGLGYVGTVVGACLARQGHHVVGVDVDGAKVAQLNSGAAPVHEPGLSELVAEAVHAGRLRATVSEHEAASQTDLSLICVGTPGLPNDDVNLQYLLRCCEQLGQELGRKSGYHVVVFRSTVLAGTTRRSLIPALEAASGRKCGLDFGVCFNPEFLREGSAVSDYFIPAQTVIGEFDARSAEAVIEICRDLPGSFCRTTLETAEMLKYITNSWHALKVGFANEVGALAKGLGIDSHEVMDLFCRDTKLNISRSYLSPGFAFGGSCLPKDLRALVRQGRMLDLELPILNAVLPSNGTHITRAFNLITAKDCRRIGVLGLSFKASTDDVRESPTVELVERLVGKGYEVVVYDPNINLSELVGSNREQLFRRIPHVARLLVSDIGQVMDRTDLIVISTPEQEFAGALTRLRPGQTLIDLVRVSRDGAVPPPGYEGICW